MAFSVEDAKEALSHLPPVNVRLLMHGCCWFCMTSISYTNFNARTSQHHFVLITPFFSSPSRMDLECLNKYITVWPWKNWCNQWCAQEGYDYKTTSAADRDALPMVDLILAVDNPEEVTFRI